MEPEQAEDLLDLLRNLLTEVEMIASRMDEVSTNTRVMLSALDADAPDFPPGLNQRIDEISEQLDRLIRK